MHDPRDDFGVFVGSEHMFFKLDDPYGFIRRSVEAGLSKQVPGTVIHAIRAHGKPKFLTAGRRTEDGAKMVVTRAGFCVQAEIEAEPPDGAREHLEATLTFTFAGLDTPGEEQVRQWIDLHVDAVRAFDDDVFLERLRGMA